MNPDNVVKLLPKRKKEIKPRAAIFLSGSGTNAERLLESHTVESSWQPVLIVTDRPKTSRAFEIGDRFKLPVVACGIKDFYSRHGEEKVTLFTKRGRELREMWTDELRLEIKPYEIDFIVLAGFVPLSNITSDFPCLNIHPGDLTVIEDGHRLLVGLHTVPIEEALVRGHSCLRSSVIMARPYTGRGDDMDSGTILGISAPVNAHYGKYTPPYLREVRKKRMHNKHKKTGDALEALALKNLDILKESGDWVVLPGVVEDFAADRFGLYKNQLVFRTASGWRPVKTVEYTETSRVLIGLDD
ncbi:hypothetical protein P0136_05060 [Lentisphaerota bacterium ZTH]|nr:hypothetical protein JYG24_03825 [Lentisphaerota bacterium]WET07360.1 hypothetical protein P0136_05060 [Lentisphaerota bacterium ZTH]